MTRPCDNCENWCEAHALYKGPEEVGLCQRDETTRAYLNRTAEDRRIELVGTKIAKLFKSAGVTPERYGAVKQWLGLPAECDCSERQAYLDRLHALVNSTR